MTSPTERATTRSPSGTSGCWHGRWTARRGHLVSSRSLGTERRATRTLLGATVTGMMAVMNLSVAGRAEQASEYDLKAAFLYNFANFIEWPADVFPTNDSPFVIGVLGADPFGGSLREVLESEQIDERPIVLQHYERADDIGLCHLLYVSRSERKELDAVLSGLKRRGLLTVGDGDDFIGRGGGVGFVGEGDRLGLAINLDTGRAVGVTFSSKLLHVAKEVEGQ